MMVDGEAEPTMHLRFVFRDGWRVLQQQFRVVDLNAGLPAPHYRYEWRDVPLYEPPLST